MARKIPWATGVDTITPSRRQTPVPRKKTVVAASSEDDAGRKVNPHQTLSPLGSLAKPRRRKRERSRTPSSSPPRAPPDIQLMHEGYDVDDVYMMVEDEFQTVAQSFTHGLHHAEYMRMKKKARQAPRPALPQTVIGMRTELKRKYEANGLHARQKRAVKSMVNGASRLTPDDEEEINERDPWQGTSLAGLMSMDGSQKKTALVGLENIASSTRAAKGFSRGKGESPAKREEKRSIIEIFGGKTKRDRNSPPTPRALVEEEDVEDDDLDPQPATRPEFTYGKIKAQHNISPVKKKTRDVPLHSSGKSTTVPEPAALRSEVKVKTEPVARSFRPSSKFSPSMKRSKIDDFDDFDESHVDDFSIRPSSTVGSTGKSRLGRKTMSEKNRKARSSDIPTFLV